jgi:hypothetical protein
MQTLQGRPDGLAELAAEAQSLAIHDNFDNYQRPRHRVAVAFLQVYFVVLS